MNKIKKLYIRFNNSKGKKIEIGVLIAYIVLKIIIISFHEPWFDENQAWLIAKSASLMDILTKIPHDEGHPPLWHLIIMPFAKAGLPMELTLKLLVSVFTTICIALILFKSPFKRIIRVAIPFTYFFFYQYGIISRCYCVMMLAFILCAITYKDRDDKPFRFIGSLIILLLSSAYGIVLAAGICLVWLYDIWNKRNIFKFIKEFIRDKRCLALLTITIVALLAVVVIIPNDNTYATNREPMNSFMQRIIYMLFIAPAEALCYDMQLNGIILKLSDIYWEALIAALPLCLIIDGVLIMIMRKYKVLKEFLIPYIMLAIVGAQLYFSLHHIGIITLLILYVFWVGVANNKPLAYNGDFINKFKINSKDKIKLHRLLVISIVCAWIVSISFSVVSSIKDIRNNYGGALEIAEFIKDNNLENKKIINCWNTIIDSETGKEEDYMNIISFADVVGYFEKNIIYNFNYGDRDALYLSHTTLTDKETQKYFEYIASNGYPDVIIGEVKLNEIFGDDKNIPIYVPVKFIDSSIIWKYRKYYSRAYIYMRKDKLSEYKNIKQLKGIEPLQVNN